MPNAAPEGFPRSRWGRESLSPWFGPAYAIASSRLGSRVVRVFVPLDRAVLRASKGRYTLFGPTTLPTLLLTTTGRKSGEPRATALSYLRDGDRLLVLGSNFGQSRHPSWTANLMAHPRARVAIGGQELAVQSTLLSGAEKDRCLQRFLTFPMYRAYRTRTDRELRLFALTRA